MGTLTLICFLTALFALIVSSLLLWRKLADVGLDVAIQKRSLDHCQSLSKGHNRNFIEILDRVITELVGEEEVVRFKQGEYVKPGSNGFLHLFRGDGAVLDKLYALRRELKGLTRSHEGLKKLLGYKFVGTEEGAYESITLDGKEFKVVEEPVIVKVGK